jgi:tetratricopeptide (TPR) repeat protein
MERFFGRKITSKFNLEEKANEEKAKEEKPSEPEKKNKTNSITDIQKFDLYNKGINHMANEKLSDAIKCFELSLRIDPKFVNAWIKKGY